MVPKLYIDTISPPCRAVLMCVKAAKINLDIIQTILLNQDHLKPEFIKLNPLHTVPTLDDDGFILCDSHAIMGYLITNYAKDKSLYPDDTKKRALIDQRLHFDSGILFARHLRMTLPIFINQVHEVAEEHVKALNEAYGFVEKFLQESKYVAGDNLSIADFSIITSITNASALVPLDEAIYPKIVAWRNRLKNLPYYEINQTGADKFVPFIQSRLIK